MLSNATHNQRIQAVGIDVLAVKFDGFQIKHPQPLRQAFQRNNIPLSSLPAIQAWITRHANETLAEHGLPAGAATDLQLLTMKFVVQGCARTSINYDVMKAAANHGISTNKFHEAIAAYADIFLGTHQVENGQNHHSNTRKLTEDEARYTSKALLKAIIGNDVKVTSKKLQDKFGVSPSTIGAHLAHVNCYFLNKALREAGLPISLTPGLRLIAHEVVVHNRKPDGNIIDGQIDRLARTVQKKGTKDSLTQILSDYLKRF